VVADGTAALRGGLPPLPLVDEASVTGQLDELFAEIRAFYARPTVPLPFRVIARDPAYARDVWMATRRAFEDNRLSRRFKEALAFAVSLTARSPFGVSFHLDEMRRPGVGEAGVREVMGVAQMFSSYAKIADTLQLAPDMVDLAAPDPSPAPGGPAA
jgi:alkylhydroperoxidase/carboxymuconolactone decarboxylase family protein YurZ